MEMMTMKKIIISWLFCLVTGYSFGQDVCWYFRGEKICYEVSATRILVQTTETLDSAGLGNALRNPVAGSLKNIYDMGTALFVIEMENTSREDMWALQRQLSVREDIIFTSPLFGLPPTAYTNKIYVRIKSVDGYPVLQKYAETYQIDIKIDEYYGTGNYILTLPHNPEKDAMQTTLELYETGLFQYVELDCIILCAFESCPFEPEPNMKEDIPE
jgi:hypothetical protein